MATFDKVGCYHSDLTKAGDIVVTITSEGPQKSKYAGKPNFIGFQCDGKSHTLSIENDAIGEALTGFKGQTVMLRASGRGENATIEVLDAGSAPTPPPARPPAQAPAKAAPAKAAPAAPAAANRPASAPHTPESELKAYNQMRRLVAQTGLTIENCLRASRAAFHRAFNVTDEGAEAFDGKFMADIRATANTQFIEVKNLVSFPALPTKAPDPNAAKPPPPPPPPPPEPEPPAAAPENDLDPDDIPF